MKKACEIQFIEQNNQILSTGIKIDKQRDDFFNKWKLQEQAQQQEKNAQLQQEWDNLFYPQLQSKDLEKKEQTESLKQQKKLYRIRNKISIVKSANVPIKSTFNEQKHESQLETCKRMTRERLCEKSILDSQDELNVSSDSIEFISQDKIDDSNSIEKRQNQEETENFALQQQIQFQQIQAQEQSTRKLHRDFMEAQKNEVMKEMSRRKYSFDRVYILFQKMTQIKKPILEKQYDFCNEKYFIDYLVSEHSLKKITKKCAKTVRDHPQFQKKKNVNYSLLENEQVQKLYSRQ